MVAPYTAAYVTKQPPRHQHCVVYKVLLKGMVKTVVSPITQPHMALYDCIYSLNTTSHHVQEMQC